MRAYPGLQDKLTTVVLSMVAGKTIGSSPLWFDAAAIRELESQVTGKLMRMSESRVEGRLESVP